MITANTNIVNEINSPVRDIKAKVEIYKDSTLVETCYCEDRVRYFNVERVGEESKFFGFGICHRLNIHLIDKNRTLSLSTANSIKVYLGTNEEFVKVFPTFYISEVRRDEVTNELSVTAYDIMYPDSSHFVSDLGLFPPYTVKEFVAACAASYGTNGYEIQRVDEEVSNFSLVYAEGANFDGTETIREALNDVAELTTTIFYIDHRDKLIFKRMDKNADPDFIITKDKYITLESRTNRRLGRLIHTTELGDNVAVPMATGTTQYLRDNAFLELRTDVATVLERAFNTVNRMLINQFDCAWRGNFLTEVGDKIGLVTYDDDTVEAYIINDTISYDGTFSQHTQWSYTDNDVETETNPTNLGDALNQTFAKVDKINKEISLVVREAEELQEKSSELLVTSEGILTEVKVVEKNTQESVENLNNSVTELAKKVQTAITAENVSIAIQQELSNGVNAVTTTTGFTFDNDGLTIEKSGSEMSTQITEDGMTVYRDDTAVLIANNIGVEATNLHARTYLIIGNYSRFEDYINIDDELRTGCFWIGD